MNKVINICIFVIIIILLILVLVGKTTEGFNNNTLDTALIVEPRKHKYLIPVVKNFIKNIPNNTKIQIFHGTNNLEFIEEGLGEYIKTGKIILNNLNVENLTIYMYNKLLTSNSFWHSVNGENILLFQTDTCLCSNNKEKIYDILNYDYVGGPWKSKYGPPIGGNGGLSFRKKTKMIEVCKKTGNGNTNEDGFFSSRNEFNYPSINVAKNIFVETIFSPKPLGVHKCWNFLNKEEMDELKQNCPEIKEIFNK
jgi:hypothetical protein